MRNFCSVSQKLFRQFSIAAFSEFLPAAAIKDAALKYRNVRNRVLTVQSYLWLSVFYQLNRSIQGLTELIDLGWHYVKKKLQLADEEKPVSKQAFSKRNIQLSWSVWRDIFEMLTNRFAALYGRTKFLFKEEFVTKILDATTIELAARLQRWYWATSNAAGKAKRAMTKVLTVYNLSLGIPEQIEMNRGKANEKKKVSKVLNRFKAGELVLMDLGFWSFALFDALTKKGVFFISRLQGTTAFKKKRKICKGNWLVRLGKYRSHPCKHPVRLVRAKCPSNGKYVYYITNILAPATLSSEDIASAYALRWQIEIFFRDLKALFPLRLNLSRDVNGIKAQLYIALITYVLVQFLLRKAAKLTDSPVEEFSLPYAVKVIRSWLQQHWVDLFIRPGRHKCDLLESIAEFSHIHIPQEQDTKVLRARA